MGEVVLKNNITINYFAGRKHTEKILKEIEKWSKKDVFIARCAICAKNLRPTGSNSSKKGSGHLTKTYDTGTSTIQTGAPKTLFLN